MTTKTITGTYSAGYLLNSSFGVVDITSTGSVGGFGLVTTVRATVQNHGHLQSTLGANGVDLGSGGGEVDNYAGAVIRGGQGAVQSKRGVTGYAGGAGVYMTVYGSISANSGQITGGAGGVGGTLAGAGGVGGAGASFHAGGYVLNAGAGVLRGGAGGTGGAASVNYPQFAGAGGAGGGGVVLAASGYIYDSSSIYGGVGGHGGYGLGASGKGGAGGAGITFAEAGSLNVYGGAVIGGTGGVGGASAGHYAAYAGYGGAGGAGVSAAGAVTIVDRGVIEGAVGGTGGSAASPGHAGSGGAGGAGLALAAGGIVINYGLVEGGAGGAGGSGLRSYGGDGGDGVDLSAGGDLRNLGTILGGSTSTGLYAGIGVSIAGAGEIINGSGSDKTATIRAGTYNDGGADGVFGAPGSQVTAINYGTIASAYYAVDFRSSLDTLVVEAGSTFLGKTNGGGGVLDLASGTGTVSFFGGGYEVTVSGSMPTTTFDYFNTLELAQGTSFSLSGAASIGAAPTQTVIADGTLTIGSTLSVAGDLQVAGKIAGAKHAALVIDGGVAQFNKGTSLTVPTVEVTAGSQVTMATSLTVKGVWDQTGGTLTVDHAKTLTFTASGSTFAGTLTEAGKGIADVVFAPTAAAASDSLDGVTINALRVNAANTTFTVGSSGATITATASLDFDTTSAGITGAAATDVLTLEGGIFGDGSIGEGQMGLVVQGEIQSQDLGSVTTGLIINTGSGEDINDNLVIADSTGGVTYQSTLVNNGEVIAEVGTLTLGGAVSGTGSAQVSGGVVYAASTFNQAVFFTTTVGTLELAHGQAYTATITGFSRGGGNYLDLNDIGLVSSGEATFSGTATGGVLTVTDGAHTAKISLSGDYLGATFVSAADGHNGTIVHVQPPPAATPPAQSAPRPHVLVTAMAALGAGSAPLAPHGPDPTRAWTTHLVAPRSALA